MLVITAHESQQVKQTGKQVENGNEQRNRCHDVVGLVAVHHAAGLEEDHARHQQHEHRRDDQLHHAEAEDHRVAADADLRTFVETEAAIATGIGGLDGDRRSVGAQ